MRRLLAAVAAAAVVAVVVAAAAAVAAAVAVVAAAAAARRATAKPSSIASRRSTASYRRAGVSSATRRSNMEFLRDRIIEAGLCGGLDLGWNLKRGGPDISVDFLAERRGGSGDRPRHRLRLRQHEQGASAVLGRRRLPVLHQVHEQLLV